MLRLLGTGVTDVNGNAVMTKDAGGQTLVHSYTGTGAGLVDVVAECTIDSSTIVSTPYEVLDCLKYDKGTSDAHNDIWDNQSYVSRGTDYSTLQATTSARGFHFMSKIAETDFKIKFKIHNTSAPSGANIVWQFDTTSQQANGFAYYGITGGDVEITKIGNNVTTKVNGETTRTNTLNKSASEIFRMSFMTGANGDNILISDLEAYPI